MAKLFLRLLPILFTLGFGLGFVGCMGGGGSSAPQKDCTLECTNPSSKNCQMCKQANEQQAGSSNCG
ncbi:MAG: hypothetical protein HY921_08645 [Elusimicrobia bacterium]|nr:hypothetical protein [Elusimicrobiota bacterium]